MAAGTVARTSSRAEPGRAPGGGSPATVEREAFKAFPYGLLVLDGGGRVLCRNDEASRLIEALGLDSAELTCCELLGCRRPGSVLAEACLAELVAARSEALPEVRVDLTSPLGTRAMWVAAAPIDGESSGRIVLQLRPGLAHDRRKRTSARWRLGPTLRIRTLGGTELESTDGAIAGSWLDQRPGQLLKYLVAERRRPVPVEEIAESLWPGSDYAVSGSVRYYVHTLRRKIEPQRDRRAPSAFIVARAGCYSLNHAQVWVDADEFEQRVTAGLATLASGPQSAVVELECGLELYRGDFLTELPYADWAMVERDRLRDLACAALRALSEHNLREHRLEEAVDSLERLSKLQPYDEDVHQRLMELDIARGRRSSAVRRYEALRSRIRRTFGHDPNFTPADLAPRILQSADC